MPHHHHTEELSDSRLLIAIAVNLLLTIAEVVGGLLSGSLSLIADALHNFGDCASLFIALVARRIARKPADQLMTFGYRRAEVVGALINLTALIVIGAYLVFESIHRVLDPVEIEGGTVIVIAGLAFLVDAVTALILLPLSHGNLNLRAAFLHNLGDALGSLAVIVVGICILWWQLYIMDVIATIAIACYILWQSLSMMRQAIRILMNSAPQGLDIQKLVDSMQDVQGVENIHHLHLWQIDEHQLTLEAHVVVGDKLWPEITSIKQELKSLLDQEFKISHSTLEFEHEKEVRATAHDQSLISNQH